MLLIVRCIPIAVTLKYFKHVAVEWMKCGKCRFSVPQDLWETLYHVEQKSICAGSVLAPFNFVHSEVSFDFLKTN